MGKMFRLSAVAVQRIKTRGRHADGGCLYLQVDPKGNKSWVFRYASRGVERVLGLGPIYSVSLAEAREKARLERNKLLVGIDPFGAKREASANALSFRDAAQRFFDLHSNKWSNEKHRAQFLSTMTDYAFPVIGDVAVSAITTGHILRVIEPNMARQDRDRFSRPLAYREGLGLGKGPRLSERRKSRSVEGQSTGRASRSRFGQESEAPRRLSHR
jgi:hypothetical protein